MKIEELNRLTSESCKTAIGEKIFRTIRVGLADSETSVRGQRVRLQLSKDHFMGLLAEGGQVIDTERHGSRCRFVMLSESVIKKEDDFSFVYKLEKITTLAS